MTSRSQTAPYKSWAAMLRRCDAPQSDDFHRYGGRGITVAAAWRDYECFLRDMGPRPAGTTLDRIDPNGNYEPGNCRWATSVEQNRNRRDNLLLTVNGQTKCAAEWAELYGISRFRIYDRLRKGFTPEQAMTQGRYVRRRAAQQPATQEQT